MYLTHNRHFKNLVYANSGEAFLHTFTEWSIRKGAAAFSVLHLSKRNPSIHPLFDTQEARKQASFKVKVKLSLLLFLFSFSGTPVNIAG
jgi:hypothetical protein